MKRYESLNRGQGMKKQNQKGQTMIEYIVVIIIILGAFLGMQNYFKRGLQGRWKSAVDTLGDQYDPRVADSRLRHTLVSNSNTEVISVNSGAGFVTTRKDKSLSSEKKTGYVSVGAY